MRIGTSGHPDDDELDLEYVPHKTMFEEMCEENAAKVALVEHDVCEKRKTLEGTKARVGCNEVATTSGTRGKK
ncbi:hypothetical protein Y032_0348g3170 [Ancylostoma ceylanicum]|nr:hypothetical protein Y032_0348g3170 [Ancylostoma ceylanicum]